MKQLRHTLETCVYSHAAYATSIYFCFIQMKHLQYTSETLKTLETCVYSHSNICNIEMKIRLKHLKHRIATYTTSQIYFCNIQMKHLKHKFETPGT
jgi:hypothetical protein